MNEPNAEEVDLEEQTQSADVEVYLDRGDSYHLEDLKERFGEELVLSQLKEIVTQQVREMNDNQEQIAQQIKQAQQAQQQGGPSL